MKYSNLEMERMAASLSPLLERRDRIGYAAARNARLLGEELTEYRVRRDALVREMGEEVVGPDGAPTGKVSISPASPRFAKFRDALEPFAAIEHEPRLMRLPFSEAVGQLSGNELLAADWMFTEDGEVGA